GQSPVTGELLLGVPRTIRGCEHVCTAAEEARILYPLLAAILGDYGRKCFDTPIKRHARFATRPYGLTGQRDRDIRGAVTIGDIARFWLSRCARIASDADMTYTRQPQASMSHPLAWQQA